MIQLELLFYAISVEIEKKPMNLEFFN